MVIISVRFEFSIRPCHVLMAIGGGIIVKLTTTSCLKTNNYVTPSGFGNVSRGFSTIIISPFQGSHFDRGHKKKQKPHRGDIIIENQNKHTSTTPKG
jgi:hypothetical protein